jgi:hypothetical protein
VPTRTPLTSLIALGTAALCAGCGPFGYLKKVAKDASSAVADAEAVGAEEYAPYEYWGAVAYLEQAKILMGYSEYERSFDYGTRAVQLAGEAKAKAERREAGKDVVSDPDIATPDQVPAGEGQGGKGGSRGAGGVP